MLSTLEQVVRHDFRSKGRMCATLRRFLDDGRSLYQLRKVSRAIKAFVDGDMGMLFNKLYARAPFQSSDQLTTLIPISAYCKHLSVHVGEPTQAHLKQPGFSKLINRCANRPRSVLRRSSFTTAPKTARPQTTQADIVDRRSWTFLFKHFTRLTTMTFRAHGNPAWPGCTSLESTLITLRLALERAGLSTLRTLILSPVHISGIIHLRWSAFGAFVEPPSAEISAGLWQSLTTLKVHLRNPMGTVDLSLSQAIMATKILQEYLRSFSATLRRLEFIWLDAVGPSPLLLDQEAGMEAQETLSWPALEEFWFGNITTPFRSVLAIAERAPHVRVVKALRSTHQCSKMEKLSEDAWIEVDIAQVSGKKGQVNTTASSIYSQEGVCEWSSGSSSVSSIEPQFSGVRQYLQAR